MKISFFDFLQSINIIQYISNQPGKLLSIIILKVYDIAIFNAPLEVVVNGSLTILTSEV